MRLLDGTAVVAAVSAAALLANHEREIASASGRLAAAAMEALLNAIDANDGQTGAHLRRVASYALTLGDAASFGEGEMRLIEQVALFHDIGKIHEALFDIIHDDRTLTAAERKEILTHPQRGADVLRPFDAFYPALCDGVLSHHERWDGKGYPRGLKRGRIPLVSRVVSIADTFDVITHTRRYHRGLSVETAREIILAGRGTQFDPELVDLFVFPPVFEQIMATENRVRHWQAPVGKRIRGKREHHVAEITFRWRPESRGARAPRKTA